MSDPIKESAGIAERRQALAQRGRLIELETDGLNIEALPEGYNHGLIAAMLKHFQKLRLRKITD